MWAFYGREARKLKRRKDDNPEEVANQVNSNFSDADVRMMCEKFLNVRKADVLASRPKMNDAILAAYAKGTKAHCDRH
jgi:hypothetical protein